MPKKIFNTISSAFIFCLAGSLIFSFNVSLLLADETTPVVSVPTNSSSAGGTVSGEKGASTNPSLIPAVGSSYSFLAPLPFFPGGSIDIRNGGLGGYLNGLYKAGIAIATGLALIMIVVGGLEYVSVDSLQGKSNGKARIQNAIVGLLLALASYIILQQVNPNLLKSDMQVADTSSVGGIQGSSVRLAGEVAPVSANISNYSYTQGLINGALSNAGLPSIGGPTAGSGVLNSSGVAARIVASARNNINVSTCYIVTENGRKGCGYAWGKIMTDAGITFSNLSSSQVLSTSNIYGVLASDPRFVLVSINDVSRTLPGDIIISPTEGGNIGHVGIVEASQATSIISNSSGEASIQYSPYANPGKSWLTYYGNKGLTTYIFRYR